MAELSPEQLEELVARVTAEVVSELTQHERAGAVVGELRMPVRDAVRLGDKVLWAPWTVAMPTSFEQADTTPTELL